MTKTIRILLAAIGLLLCAACTPNANDFMHISGYDAQGARTGSVIPPPATMTPY